MWGYNTHRRDANYRGVEANRLSKSRDLRKKLDAIERDVLAKAHRFAADMAEIRRKLRKLRPSTASESISARDGVHPPLSRLREALRKDASKPARKQEAPLEPAIIGGRRGSHKSRMHRLCLLRASRRALPSNRLDKGGHT